MLSAFSLRRSHPASLLPLSLPGFGFLAWQQGISLGIDAQAALAPILKGPA